ncbi:hypothetical protein [Paenibacillus polymyxa]|uniref:hypothetical protein n=1 Tax=Paenibacillus polymyxa TaxID=1406 RepID=UPI0025B6B380|nr:hypothetical protein [Paenibacillus polymyxa]MDN4084318.1 hypothetical protein [Paenibacillus polymyxa]MDN4110136.1 hypothetical protein [Paenibacillus polymyxa]
MKLKKWPVVFMLGIIMLVSVGWNSGISYAKYYYEYTWDQYKGTEIKTYRLTPVAGRAGYMDQEKALAAIGKTPNVYGKFSGYRTDKTTEFATKSVTDEVYHYAIVDFNTDKEPVIVEYVNPKGGIPHTWNGTDEIRIFMRGSEAASLAELFYEGTPSEGRYHFNANDVYLVTFWSSTAQSITGMSAEALVEEGPSTLINQEWVSQIKDKDPAAYPQNGTLKGYFYIYKGSELKKD